MESEFSPKSQGKSVEHHSDREMEKGLGEGESGERTERGKPVTTSWMKCLPRPSCDPHFTV